MSLLKSCVGFQYYCLFLVRFLTLDVPAGSPSRGGDVRVYVLDINQPSLRTPFTLSLCLFLSLWPFQLYFTPQILPTTLRFFTLFFQSNFCLIGPFNYIYIFMKVSFSPDVILCGSLGLKHQLTNYLTNYFRHLPPRVSPIPSTPAPPSPPLIPTLP